MADHFFGLTDTGKIRGNNEDTFIAQELEGRKAILACVIDGVGGYSGGEVAAAIAKETISNSLNAPSGDITLRMKEAFVAANKNIQKEKEQQSQLANMACVLTLAIVDIENNEFHYAHVGDTRLYLLRDHSLVKVSKDHSFVGFLEESGRLTEEAAMQHPKRNEINKALGLGDTFTATDDYIETGESPFLSGDLLLLCSDGLTDMVNSSAIKAILNSPLPLSERASELIAAANKNGGKDNITVVLVENTKVGRQAEFTKPETLHANSEAERIVIPVPAEKVGEKNKVPAKKIEEENYRGSTKPQNNKGIVIFLAMTSILLALWVVFGQKIKPDTTATEIPASEARNPQEIKLQDALNKLTGDTLLLSAADYPQPILISDTLLIQQDTLLIRTKGSVILRATSGYSGPGLVLAPTCKFITLDSLLLENFETGISVPNQALRLKNTRFVNCEVPVRMVFAFTDKQYINGWIAVKAFTNDSLPQTTLK
jgi:serine/threonine protein phosphatase PrpC